MDDSVFRNILPIDIENVDEKYEFLMALQQAAKAEENANDDTRLGANNIEEEKKGEPV